MGKRGQNEGSIHKRDDGRWCAILNLGYEAGKRKRKYFYGETRQEVAQMLAKATYDRDRGMPSPSGRQTVEAFLRDWLVNSAQPRLRPKTFASYRQLCENHLIPELGRKQLQKLSPKDVQTLINRKLASGLSARTVQYCHAVLRTALDQALKWGLVARNVATLVDQPRVKRKEIQ
ncbi:MAG: site-specific integrase, partial [Chloroflexota bacterium]